MKQRIDIRPGDSSTAGYISWTRLEEKLREAGEIRPTEQLQRVEIDAQGIQYYVEPTPDERVRRQRERRERTTGRIWMPLDTPTWRVR